MKKAVIRNLIVILALVVFAIFFDFIYMHYIIKYRIEAFIALIIFALVCGISLALMDLSNKLINAALAILYLLFSILASAFRIFAYGPTMYLFVLMFGYLLVSALRGGDYGKNESVSGLKTKAEAAQERKADKEETKT